MNSKIDPEIKDKINDCEISEEDMIKLIKDKLEYTCRRKLSEIFCENVISVNDETSFIKFAEILERYEYKGVPVLNGNEQIKGMVTWSDMLKLLLFYGSYGPKLMESESFIGIPSVKSIRSTSAITLKPDDTIEDAAHLMFEHNIQTIPIVENNKVVGIVGKKDILREILNIVKEITETESIKEMREICEQISNA